VRTADFDDALAALLKGSADVLAGLRPRLIDDRSAHPDTRILEGGFMAVKQAIGTPRVKSEALPYLERFVEAARTSGFIAQLICKHGVEGLNVA
jgi:polar amino acid transport system substrate-binding protein